MLPSKALRVVIESTQALVTVADQRIQLMVMEKEIKDGLKKLQDQCASSGHKFGVKTGSYEYCEYCGKQRSFLDLRCNS